MFLLFCFSIVRIRWTYNSIPETHLEANHFPHLGLLAETPHLQLGDQGTTGSTQQSPHAHQDLPVASG